MIGNSSSGLTEAPSLGLPVVNIGKRQEGRLRGNNVIDAENNAKSIENAIKKGLDKKFKYSLRDKINPYYQGPVSEQITKILLNLLKKCVWLWYLKGMSKEDLKEKIVKIIEELSGIDEEEISKVCNLISDEIIDSLGMIELISFWGWITIT